MRRSPIHLVFIAAIVVSGIVQAKEQSKGGAGSPRVVGLAIVPARVDAAQTTLTFLLKPEELTSEDGAAFYNKAVRALPATLEKGQLSYMVKEPLSNLPLDQDQAQALLQQAKVSLDLVGQGAKCKTCNWPPFVPGTMPPNLSEYRQLGDLVCLKARIEIVQAQYDKAAETIRTGLAMAKHVGEAPTVMQGMNGIAMATIQLRSVEDWAQAKGAPNLHPALHMLSRPLVDMNVPISAELKNLDSNTQYGKLVKGVMRRQLEDSFKAVRRLMNRLDGTVATLECIEGLRHFAAGHDGRLPAQLSELADIQIPNDPVTQKPFAYRAEGPKAILEVSAPEGGTLRDATRYEIAVAR